MVAMTALVFCGVHARTLHHSERFLVKHLFLVSAQGGIKSFDRVTALLHVHIALGFHGLHLI
jgi:hypothetical protein